VRGNIFGRIALANTELIYLCGNKSLAQPNKFYSPMKILKIVLIVVGSLIALPLIIALFLPKDYAVQREVLIAEDKNKVFEYIKFLKNQDQYSHWASLDPNMKKQYRGTDGTVGFVSAWESQKEDVGKGEQEIKKITEGSRVDYELRFIEPFESTEQAYMTTESIGTGQTKVVWGFNGHMPYPMNIMMLAYDFEQLIGKDLETGLQNLKKKMEAEPTS
jgi:hypothetical protein